MQVQRSSCQVARAITLVADVISDARAVIR